MPTAESNTFVLGVGCQKGATSWLAYHLSSHETCAPPFTKELHIFDSYFLPEMHPFQRYRVSQLIGQLRSGVIDETLAEHVQMGTDLDCYAQYFKERVRQSGSSLTFDITPSYATLDIEHFSRIRELMETAGFCVRVVFIMRDPVDRIYSACTMEASKAREAEAPAISFSDRVRRSYRDVQFEARTRYEITVSRLEQAFNPDHIYFALYENFFEPRNQLRLNEFLGRNFDLRNAEDRVHSYAKTDALDPELAEEVRNHYASTYEYCRQRFGPATIRKLWRAEGDSYRSRSRSG